MIPKIIHYCWVGGNALPEEAKRCIESWKRFCPDYKIIRWDESNFDFNQNIYCKEAYEAKKWAFVSDYMRLKVLYDHGGIYMDTDVEVVKSFRDLLHYNAFACFEDVNHISIGTVGACKNNEWIELILKSYEQRHFSLGDGNYDFTTNLKILTKLTVEKYGVLLNAKEQRFGDNMILFPMEYFIAKSYQSGAINKTFNTYAIHHYAGSWTKDKDFIISKLKNENKNFKNYYGLNLNNRWIRTANSMPWKELSEKFSSKFSGINIQGIDKVRFIIGMMLIKDKYQYSDLEMILQLMENKYYQFFCGINFPSSLPPGSSLPISTEFVIHCKKFCDNDTIEEIKNFINLKLGIVVFS